MKRIIIALFLGFFLVGCAGTIPTEEEKTYQKVIEMESSKDELFIKSLNWATSTFNGEHQVVFKQSLLDKGVILKTGVTQKDKEAGLIIANGYVKTGLFPVLDLKYFCRIDCKDNRVRFTFSNFKYWYDAGVNARDWQNIQKGMIDKLHSELDKLIEDYKTKMKSTTLNSDW